MAGLQVALLALLDIRMLAFDYGSANASRHPLSNRQLAIMAYSLPRRILQEPDQRLLEWVPGAGADM